MSDALLNLDGVQFARARKSVDAQYRALADALEVAYYQHWKFGKPYDHDGWDPVTFPDQGEPKAVFDMLHGAIWTEHSAAVIDANAALAEPYPEDKINPIESDGRRRKDILAERLRALETEEVLPSANFRSAVTATAGKAR